MATVGPQRMELGEVMVVYLFSDLFNKECILFTWKKKTQDVDPKYKGTAEF